MYVQSSSFGLSRYMCVCFFCNIRTVKRVSQLIRYGTRVRTVYGGRK